MKKTAQGFSLAQWKRKERGLLCDLFARSKTATNSHFSYAMQLRDSINLELPLLRAGQKLCAKPSSELRLRLCWAVPCWAGLCLLCLEQHNWLREIAAVLQGHIKVYETNKQQHTQLFWGR